MINREFVSRSLRFDTENETNFFQILQLGLLYAHYPKKINWKIIRRFKEVISTSQKTFNIPHELIQKPTLENLKVFEKNMKIHLRIINFKKSILYSDIR
jgi:hypothetical protein